MCTPASPSLLRRFSPSASAAKGFEASRAGGGSRGGCCRSGRAAPRQSLKKGTGDCRSQLCETAVNRGFDRRITALPDPDHQPRRPQDQEPLAEKVSVNGTPHGKQLRASGTTQPCLL